MKNLILLAGILMLSIHVAYSQSNFTVIDKQKPTDSKIEILSENGQSITLKLSVNAYDFYQVETSNGTEVIVKSPNGINSMEKGMPDLPYFSTSINIPAKGKVVSEILGESYFTLQNMNIAPSKGSISRKVDPSTVPFEYGKCYSLNQFIPGTQAQNGEAFIIRDVRGTNVKFFPFSYNPVEKELRVYTEIIVKLSYTDLADANEVTAKLTSIDEFESIYQRLFINYKKGTRYTPIQEQTPGRMLIISGTSYASAMNSYVTWKREKGIETELVTTATTGTTATAIKNYITSYLSSHSDLAYILLVGDHADVPTGTSSGDDSDNQYGYLVGNDHFIDVFVGRFSANSVTDVQTQVTKTIYYEKEITTGATWIEKAFGAASSEGGGYSGGHNQGHGVESDMNHMGYIQTDLENYGYTVTRSNESGGSTTAISNAFNAGQSVAFYIGHGDYDQWYSVSYTNSHVNALTNDYKLPFIFSVACQNGNFKNKTCFSEAWLRATNNSNGNPTGAVAIIGSTIDQSWNSPMTGQDEMADILCEISTYSTPKRTFAGIAFNGMFKMIEDEGSDGIEMADTWLVFGDPSLNVRTKNPLEISATYPTTYTVGSTEFTVSSNVEGAMACLSMVDNGQTVILGKAYVTGGTATITHQALTNPGTIKLTITAFNRVTRQDDIMVIVPSGPYVVAETFTINDSEGNNNGVADYNENIKINQTLKNVGVSDATNVAMSITTSSDATITDNNETFGNISADAISTRNNAFAIAIRNGIADQTNIPVNYTISGDFESREGVYYIVANAPAPSITFVGIDDSNGNNNGQLDAGENISLVFTISNEGHAQTVAGTATLSCESYASISNPENQVNAIAAGNSTNVSYNITIAEGVQTGTALTFTMNYTADLYGSQLSTTLPVGLQIEDWESNSFDTYEWQNTSNIPWVIVSGSQVYEGNYCAKSGHISNNQTTTLSITIDALNDDSIEFYKKVSCEEAQNYWGTVYYWDYLSFSIDGTEMEKWAGTNDSWSLVTYNVNAGSHTFSWTYQKDQSQSSGDDCAWIDNIKLPAHGTTTIINMNSSVSENSMNVYPNPASDIVNINMNLNSEEVVSICIYNTIGQIVNEIDNLKLNSGENYISIDTNNLKAGSYIIRANVNGEIINKNLSVIR